MRAPKTSAARARQPALARAHREAALRLAAGDPLGALSALAGRDDAHARALGGIALAQLGELAAARQELERAARAFRGPGLAVHRARALAAAGEVAANQRDLAGADGLLARAAVALARAGDRRNAAWALGVHARVLALCGADRRARAALVAAQRGAPSNPDRALRAGLALAQAEVATRRLDARAAAEALSRARKDAARVPALAREVAAAAAMLARPVVRADAPHAGRSQALDGLELACVLHGAESMLARELGARGLFVVDRCARRCVLAARATSLARRPVLFALLVRLAAAWPRALSWRTLASEVFGIDVHDESLLARAKVEIGRLRRLLPRGARIASARNAWRLELAHGVVPVLLSMGGDVSAPDADDALPPLLEALLADGVPWAIDDLAAACARSQSSVLRSLRALVESGRVLASGSARARRYLASAPAGIASQMFLVGLLDPARG